MRSNGARTWLLRILAGFRAARPIQELLANRHGRKVDIISLVRDPIARNVSTFFYALDEFVPDWEQRGQSQSLDAEQLHGIFVAKTSFVLSALNWFEEQLQPVFGIDVYATPFPTSRGYEISSDLANLLVHVEDVDRCVVRFLGIRVPDLSVNVGMN
jgi:hypothetical protein